MGTMLPFKAKPTTTAQMDLSSEVMMTLWKSLVTPILDYCSQLWCPIQVGQIQQLEEIQQAYTRKIRFNEHANY